MSVDPLTDQQESYTPYRYVYNNPTLNTDPDGKEPCCGEDPTESFALEMMVGAAVVNIKHSFLNLAYSVGDGLGVTPVAKGMKWEATQQWSDAENRYVTSMIQVPSNGRLADAGGHLLDGISAASALSPSSGTTTGLLAKAVPKTVAANATIKTIKERAEELVSLNNGKSRVTIRTNKAQIDIDLKGESHYDKKTGKNFDTPHHKISPRNYNAPSSNGPVYNTSPKHTEYFNTTDEMLRIVRNFLNK